MSSDDPARGADDQAGSSTIGSDGEKVDTTPSLLARLDRHLEPLLTDSTLQPLAIVIGLSIVAFGGGAILIAIQDRNAFAIASLGMLLLVSLDVLQRDIRDRRFGFLSRAICLLWLLCGGLVAIVIHRGWF